MARSRAQSILVSRLIIVAVVAGSLGTLFIQPHGILEWTLDILLRGYLLFIAGGMAHEGTHGHLGQSKTHNLWWGRLALLPTTVPYNIFRKTHLYHHQYTNDPELDPDAFLNPTERWQRPFRALMMPHHWLLWLRRHGKWHRADWIDYAVTYAVYLSVYAAIASQVGTARFIAGLIPATIVHGYLLWYPFAIKTHEGYSLGSVEARSHNYYGQLAYWFSCGLALHRVHHQKQQLGWLQMRPFIERGTLLQALTFRRDIRLDT